MAFRAEAQAAARHTLATVKTEKAGPGKSFRDQKMRIGVMGRMGKLHSLFAAAQANVAPMNDMFSVVSGLGEDSTEATKLAERIYLASLSGDAAGLGAALAPFIKQAEEAEAVAAAAEEAAAAAAAEAAAVSAKGGKGGKGAPEPEAEPELEIAVELPKPPEWRIVDMRGQEPLQLACARGHAEAARLLLKAKADPEAFDRAGGRTALHRAAEAGHLGAVEALIEGGAEPDARARNGVSALLAAASRGHAAIVAHLLSLTVPPPPPDPEAEAAAAAGKGKAPDPTDADEEAPAARQCPVDQSDHSGRTPLMAAASGGYAHVLAALLENAADPNVLDVNGWSALHHACRAGHRDVAMSLAKAGAAALPTRGGRKLHELDAHIAADVEALIAASPPVPRAQRPMTAPP